MIGKVIANSSAEEVRKLGFHRDLLFFCGNEEISSP